MPLNVHFRRILLTMLLTFFAGFSSHADEGMYPLTMLGSLDLAGAGLSIASTDLYNPGGISLIDAIVNVGGCTGAFVSGDGLILTNHHCVFRTLQAASTPENDLVTHGFHARRREDELRAPEHTVRIIRSCFDVSADVLAAAPDTLPAGERQRAFTARRKQLETDAEREHPGTRAEVAEMFTGKSYVLFLYTYLRDVRLVYVPPRGIGEFGGEEDNWVWPRHTGDFAFVRAYVAPDGSPSGYKLNNIPYQPRRYISVQPAGVDDGDPVFILGYPGRTYRHRSSHYVEFEERIRMPFVADLYEWQMEVMNAAGRFDRAVALKHDSRIKDLANTMKNYRGQLQGLRRVEIVRTRRSEEQRLQEFVLADPDRKSRYGSLLGDLDSVYRVAAQTAPRDLLLDYLRRSSLPLSAALRLREAFRERDKDDLARQSEYMDRNYDRTAERALVALASYHQPVDRTILEELLTRAARLPAGLRIGAVDAVFEGRTDTLAALRAFLDDAYAATRLSDTTLVRSIFRDPDRITTFDDDPFLSLAAALLPSYDELRESRQARDGRLARLMADYVDLKQAVSGAVFVPDANSTMRFTYGKVRGYSPADAVTYEPITTLRGVVDKNTGREPFEAPARLLELEQQKAYGRFVHPRLRSVPVALLYDLDTTGGNSGSPLLNSRGELVGVNFDRAYEATINDFAWDKNLSRSIAVDIRYVLWVTEKIGGAENVLQELGL